MKKLLLIAVLSATAGLQAIINPMAEFGQEPSIPKNIKAAAPAKPANQGFMSGFGDMFGGAAGGLSSSMPQIPNIGLGIATTSVNQNQNQKQNITTGSGAQGPVNAQIQAGISGTQNTTASSSATGMGR